MSLSFTVCLLAALTVLGVGGQDALVLRGETAIGHWFGGCSAAGGPGEGEARVALGKGAFFLVLLEV